MVDVCSVAIPSRRRRAVSVSSNDSGFTLVEMLTVLAIMTITFGIAVSSFVSYQVQAQHRGTWDELRSTLRNAGERALSEQRTYCVHLGATAWDVYRSDCSASATKVQSVTSSGAGSVTTTSAFAAPSGHESACPTAAADCVYFYPRGNASDGTATVSRAGRSDLLIDVEGLTARVSARD